MHSLKSNVTPKLSRAEDWMLPSLHCMGKDVTKTKSLKIIVVPLPSLASLCLPVWLTDPWEAKGQRKLGGAGTLGQMRG